MTIRRTLLAGGFVLLVSAMTFGQSAVEKTDEGIMVQVGDSFLKLEVCSAEVVRVAFAKDRGFFARKSLVASPRRCEATQWNVIIRPREAVLITTKLKVKVDLTSGALSFFDQSDQPIVMEKQNGRTLTPAEVQGEKTFQVRQVWQANADEALYGLGQHQFGLMDFKARFGDLRAFEFIPSQHLFDASGKMGGLTGTYYSGANFDRLVATRTDARVDIATPDRKEHPHTRIHPDLPATGNISIRWQGEVKAPASGDYLFQTYSNSGVKLWLNDQLVINHWRQGWLPWKDMIKVHLEVKHHYRLKLEWTRDQEEETMQLFWKTPAVNADTSLWSEVGDGIDYYFMYGPEIDQVIAGYRRISGQAPMMPRWAFGLWQCRQRYETQQQSLDIFEGFRSRNIPIDNIVQDWFYWKADQWGSHQFDPERFPDSLAQVLSQHRKCESLARPQLPLREESGRGRKGLDQLRLYLLRCLQP